MWIAWSPNSATTGKIAAGFATLNLPSHARQRLKASKVAYSLSHDDDDDNDECSEAWMSISKRGGGATHHAAFM